MLINLWFIVGIIAVSIIVPITKLVTDHKEKMAKIKGELVSNQIELEKLKQQNFVIETEKMKIELEKLKLDTENMVEIEKKNE